MFDGLLVRTSSLVFCNRVVEVVGRLKSQMAEPSIMCHWSLIGCDTRSLVTIHITSPEIGHVARSVLLVKRRAVFISHYVFMCFVYGVSKVMPCSSHMKWTL